MQKILTVFLVFAVIYLLIKDDIKSPPEKMRAVVMPEYNQDMQKNTKDKSGKQKAEEPLVLEGSFLERTLSKMMINTLKTEDGRLFMESLIQPMGNSAQDGFVIRMNNDAQVKRMFKIRTFGDEDETQKHAYCGNIVTVDYKIFDMRNIIVSEKTDNFPLGRSNVPGLDAVIVGMQKGQTRHAIISSKYFPDTSGNKEQRFKISVTLKDINLTGSVDASEVQLFDDVIANKTPLLCGNKAVFDVKVINLSKNKQVFDSKANGSPVDMKIGDIGQPAIFSFALHNKTAAGARTVITPGKYLKSYAAPISKIFPNGNFQENDYYMIIFNNFEELDPRNKAKTVTPEHLKQTR